MRFAVFLPSRAELGRVPVLYWLSGLTCTEENFIVKAGAQRIAEEVGLAIVADQKAVAVTVPLHRAFDLAHQLCADDGRVLE